MSDLFRDFLVWLMGFTGCSVLVFAAACFAKNQFKSRRKHVTGKRPADSQHPPKFKWLMFAIAPVLYLLLLGPALSELNTHFQKIQSERAVLTRTAEISQTIEPVPNSIGTRVRSRIGYPLSTGTLHRTGPCSCQKTDPENALTQSAKPDVSSDLDESEWEASPGSQLSTGDMNDIVEGDVAEVDQDNQVD